MRHTSHVKRVLCAIVLLASCALCLVPRANAEDVSFDASVDATTVSMGTAAQLVLTVHGSQNVDKIDLPAIDGFEAHYVGPSTKVQVINGEYSTAKAFSYALLPLKEGKFTIPSLDVTVNGQVYHSQPIVMDVVSASGAAPGSSDQQVSLSDKIHLAVVLPKTQCYVNEELPLTVRLYVYQIPMQDITLPQIPQEGFVLSDYDQPRQYAEIVDGKKVEVVEFTARLTPTRAGFLNVGPAALNGNILFKTKERRSPFGNSVFDDDFFSGFFGGGYQKKMITITAEPLELSVQDLPLAGRPAAFSGGVGRFSFDAGVSPAEVKVGDPLTLRMAVEGDGDLKTIKMPSFKDDRFKTYEPQIKEEGGKKIAEQVLIPVSTDIKEVPVVRFSYFDPSEGRYQTISRGPFAIQVKPADKGEEFQAMAFTPGVGIGPVKESFGKDIVFIKDRVGDLRRARTGHDWLFYGLIVAYVQLLGAFLGAFLYRKRVGSDHTIRRRMSAAREVKAGLARTKELMEGGASVRECYDVLSETLRNYFVSKFQLPPGKLEADDLENALLDNAVDKKAILSMRQVWKTFEEVKFAPSGALREDDLKRTYLDVEEIVEAVERRVR